MTSTERHLLVATLLFLMAVHGRKTVGQTLPGPTQNKSQQTDSLPPPASFLPKDLSLANRDASPFHPEPSLGLEAPSLFEFKESQIKFKLETLMDILRDSRHENWVLAAYPDPKTGRPLIGAGFSLDVSAVDHIQRDPLNHYQFIEPATRDLWIAAGLDLELLQNILDRFDGDLDARKARNVRVSMRASRLSPELTEEEATRLLRISTIQAIHNARAYCRGFDLLTASQQMALSQLVFQMGVNLEEFVHFLSAINDYSSYREGIPRATRIQSEKEHWRTVQQSLVHSDWARRYTNRAVAVIAMFDPDYDNDPKKAERQVRARIRPLVTHRRNKPRVKAVLAGSRSSHLDQMEP
jgi:hypothetical protein